MKRTILAAVLGMVLLGPIMPVLRAEVTPEEVRDAIKHAVNFIEQQQRADGSWSDYGGYPGGVTALCTLALLNAGVPADDDHIQHALGRIERYSRPQLTYVTALQTMVYCQANPKQYLARIQRNADWLEATQIKEGPYRGGWSYPQGSGDNSNSQFALLALHEAEHAGATVRYEAWARAKAYWEEAQNVDGSWGYHKKTPGTGSMTCAGIASLIITSDRFRQPNVKVVGDQILCCQRADADDDRFERAMQWLGHTFTVSGNPGYPGQLWLMYYLYGVERVGRMTAQRFLGKHDWYR
jgi:prenyltransferase beta subunit